LDRVIEKFRQQMASMEELCENESRRLKRNVSHREKMIDKLEERLENSIEEAAKLRDRENAALREALNVSAKDLLLRDERDAAVAKRKTMVKFLEELKDEKEQLVEDSEAGAEEWAKTQTKGKGRPHGRFACDIGI
jgi:exonuclease VII large subunit